MKSFKLVKYNIKSSIKSIIIYYSIFITVLISISILIVNKSSGAGVGSAGIEFSSMIFLFVIGLNSFKENFYFTQANNIPRIDYFKSQAITILPIALGMSMLDVIINRIYNIFVACPTIYDMAYGGSSYSVENVEAWTQSNSIETLIGTVTFLFAFYITVFAIGLLITMIFYKCNKTMRIIVVLSPLFLQVILARIAYNFPNVSDKVTSFIDSLLGISTKNSYMSVITFICLFIISMCFVYMLVRRVVVKRG